MAFQSICLFLAAIRTADGHAWLKVPLSRNGISGATSCPHCGQGDGPNTVKKRNPKWPTHQAYGGHGLCGDPFQGEATTSYEDEPFLKKVSAVQETYKSGTMVQFTVYISTHHNGHMSYRLCDKVISPQTFKSAKEGQDCLDQYELQRVDPSQNPDGCPGGQSDNPDCQPLDPKHPERWYLPPRTAVGASANEFKMWYWLPKGVTCEKCTLQWYWVTGNTCLYDGDYCDYFGPGGTFASAGWTGATSWNQFASQSWGRNQVCKTGGTFGEEFWNCADIKITAGSGGGAPTPSPRPTRPSPRPTRPSPRPAPSPSPTPSGGGLAKQCRSKCGQKTGKWTGDFAKFEGNNNFCSCGWAKNCDFIAGGGGGGGPSVDKAACGDQHVFKDDTWRMYMTKKHSESGSPYRLFAFLPFTETGSDYTLAFSFRTGGMKGWGGYVKLLFWTDSGNIIGLLPPGATAGKGKPYRLITFMQDDYPNKWADEVEIDDNTWYSVKVRFQGKKVTVGVTGAGVRLTSTNSAFSLDCSGDAGNGPQLGIYHFDFGTATYESQRITMDIAAVSGPGGNVDRHDCEHGCLAAAGDGSGGTPSPSPSPSPSPAPLPSPSPSGGGNSECLEWCSRPPVPWTMRCEWSYCSACGKCSSDSSGSGPAPATPVATPEATPVPSGPDYCCGWGECSNCEDHNKQGEGTWCGANADQCGVCNGKWCPR